MMHSVRLAFCVLALLATSVMGDDISLIRVGETWRYYRGTNEPSTPATAWRTLGFDDSSWRQGPSGFSTTTYSATEEATLWNHSPPEPLSRSFYLRRKFTLADPAVVKWLVLRLDYTHGFVAYLNGQEIIRRGLTNNPVACDNYADYHFSGAAEEFDVSSFSGLLSVGENVLAIQVHTAVTNPPGYDSSMRLVPELLANFQRGPFLANPSTNSIQVIWRTPVAADSAVDFGTNQSLAAEISDSVLTTNHVMTLTNLLPGTEYFYRIRSAAGEVAGVSPLLSFRTFKPSGDFTFLVTADGGDGAAVKYQVANLMAQTSADLALHCGDIVYDYFSLGREDYRCLSAYGPQMRSVPFYFSMGNHEVDGPSFEQPYLQTLYLPTNPVTGTEHFYSFDQGDAHFTVLFVPSLKNVPEYAPFQLTNGSPQYCWLTNDLASSAKPWKFLVMHVPLANSGYHRPDDDDNNGVPDRLELQQWLLPVAQRYGVQIIFSGNDHDYERSNPMGGVYQIVTGGGGGRLPNYGFVDGRDPANSQFYLVSEFVRVAVQGDSLLLQAIGTNDAVFDSMTIQRRPPPPQEYTASWDTPLVETAPADDGHGNINGQTFDFSGTPIPTLAGDFSNLGRVYVNNDATNLFLGLEQVMIYSNQNVFLFIELPGPGGVTSLVGLGDGRAGTDKGVDGLDFLENLSFTNFAPSIACLLGDEYADGQDRHFVRPGLGLDLGQGVFRLNKNFFDVSGIRIQQFNRSPQVLEPPLQLQYPERNANFIEVAIPFDQLGGLWPGDTIKVAAVVGMAGFDTNAQTRELDTSFLGSSMTGSGQSNVVLGGVSVRLAPAVLKVKADDQTRAYGGTNGPLTVTYSGFLNGEDASFLSGSPALSTGADTNSPVGTYPITVSVGTLSNAHYSFSCTNGTLTVTQAVLSAKAGDQTRVYGAANAPLTVSYGGFVNGQDTNILSGSVELSTVAETNSPVGAYPITVSQGTLSVADTNYSLAFEVGSLTVTQAILSVTADNQVRSYGAANPVFTGTVVGIQNEDEILASYDTMAQTNSPVGNYEIVPGLAGGALGNYLVTANSGTLTVTPAALSGTADSHVRGYGATNPPLTISYSGFVNGQDTNILNGDPSLSTVAETNSPAGIYSITVSQGTLSVADTNYTLAFIEGALSVTQALLTVKADDQMRLYGATNAPLTASYSGFVNGQDTNILSGDPSLSTVAETNSPAGTYVISVSQGTLSVADTNYRLAFVEGSLTVVLPAAILSGPVDLVATNGDTVLLIVTAQGTEPLTCQWYFNQTNSLAGATNTTLVLSNVSPAQAGSYAVSVTNAYGGASGTASLVVITLPTIACATNRTAELGSPWDFETPTATGSNVMINVLSTVTNTTCGDAFSATRTWVATDADGYQAVCSQTVDVVDTIPPVISCGADRTVAYGSDWTFDPTTARDAGVVDNFVYDNSVNDLLYRFNPGPLEVGNEIILAGSARYASLFSFEFWGFSTAGYVFEGDVRARVRFYKNDGPLFSGYRSPGTVMFDSGSFPIPATPAGRATLIFDEFQIEAVVPLRSPLPSSFTWTVQFSGLSTNDSAGVDLYAPPVIGNSYLDYWERETNQWTLRTNSVPMEFASRLYTVSRGVDVTVVSTVTNAGPGNSFTATRTWQAVDACSNNATCSQSVTVVGLPPPCSSTNYILSMVRAATNSFIFTFLGTTNAQYYVLETTNLATSMTNWTVLPDSTNTATNGVWSYTVTNVGFPSNGLNRFFRAGAVNPCP